jgi:hypothetical protein
MHAVPRSCCMRVIQSAAMQLATHSPMHHPKSCNNTHCAPVHAPPSRGVACGGLLRRRGPWVQRASDGGVTQHRQVGVRRQDPVVVVQWLPSLLWITCRSHGESLNRPLTNPFHIHLTTTCDVLSADRSHATMHSNSGDSCTFRNLQLSGVCVRFWSCHGDSCHFKRGTHPPT